jgi:hypothetical protein
MNFQTTKLLVTRNLGNRTDLADYIKEWINSTYMDLITTGKFPEAAHFAPIPIPALDGTYPFNTAASDPDYVVPTDFLFPISLRDTTNNNPLRLKDIRWYDRKRSTVIGKAYNYAIYGSFILLNPTPDNVYAMVLRYRKKLLLPILVNDGDTPVVGEEWHEGIVLGATYRGARSLNYPEATRWHDDWKAFIVGHSEQTTEEEEDSEIGFNFSF